MYTTMATTFKKGTLPKQTKLLEKPPLPVGIPGPGRFLNRSSLFSSPCTNKFFALDGTPSSPGVTTGPQGKLSQCTDVQILNPTEQVPDRTPYATPRKQGSKSVRRAQTTKGRVTNSAKASRTDKESNSPRRRPPASAPPGGRPYGANATGLRNKGRNSVNKVDREKQVAVIDLSDKVFGLETERLLALSDPRDFCDAHSDLPRMSFSRNSQSKYQDHQGDSCVCKGNNLPEEVDKKLKPSVYGLKKQRQVFGSTPDLRSANVNFEHYPFKLIKENDMLGVDAPKTEPKAQSSRLLPKTLECLRPWLVKTVSQEVLGVDPSSCLVFLPNADDLEDLPEVPDPHYEDEDLPFTHDLTTPKPWSPKKYPHPFNKIPVEDWVCKHRGHGKVPFNEQEWFQNYSKKKGKRRSQQPRMRTVDVIKKEIDDLENLLNGIGSEDSDCAMVLYQADVSRLQGMLDDTMQKVPDRLKNPKPPSDRFGVRHFCSEHDTIIQQVKERMMECRLELADLEIEAGIDSARQYFRKRVNST